MVIAFRVRLGVVGGQPDVLVEGETLCLGERHGAIGAAVGQLVVDRQRRRPGRQAEHRVRLLANNDPIASAATGCDSLPGTGVEVPAPAGS